MVKRAVHEDQNFTRKSAKFLVKRNEEIVEQNKTDLVNFYSLNRAGQEGKTVDQVEIPWYLSAAVKYFPETFENVVENHVPKNRNLWYLASTYRKHIELQERIEMFPTGRSTLVFTVYKIVEINDQTLFEEIGNDYESMKIFFDYESRLCVDDALNLAYKTHEYFRKVRRVPNWPSNISDRDFKNSVIKYEVAIFKFKSEDRSISMPSTALLSSFPHHFFKAYLSPVQNEQESSVRLDIYFDLLQFEDVPKTDGLFQVLSKYFTQHLLLQLEKGQLGNTLDFLPYTPPGFDCRLFDYQKRSLKWMMDVENKALTKERQVTHLQTSHIAQFDSIPNTFVNFLDNSLIKRTSSYYDSVDYICNGGVLADNPGYGKTITTLALIHSNPLPSFTSLNMSDLQKFAMFPSKATLVVCPNNLVEQWRLEVLEWLPSETVCYTISKMKDLYDISWMDIVLADIIIVAIGFFQNTAYTKMLQTVYGKLPHGQSGGFYFAEAMRDIISNREERASEKGQINLEAFYYHRVVFDEFHELDQYQNGIKEITKNIKADWVWGMTGTPRFKNTADIELSAKYLQVDLQNSSVAGCLSFKDRFIRRNNEDIALPPVYDQIEWITLTAGEMGLYEMASAGKGGPRSPEAFAACSHYQINNDAVDAAGSQVLSTDEVAELLHGRLTATIEAINANIKTSQRAIKEIKENLRDDDHFAVRPKNGSRDRADREVRALEAELEGENRNLKQQRMDLAAKMEELATFDVVRERLSTVQACRICTILMENSEDVALTPCCTKFLHFECLNEYLEDHQLCLFCDQQLDRQMVKVIKRNGQAGGNDVEKCGSKITAMLKRLKALQNETPNFKVIVFSQFKRLANLIYLAFKDAGVETSYCHGSTQMRTKAIADFKSPNTTAILLSTEDSVSGLHLPEATHIFIAHPFWFGDKPLELERAISAEKQGIARAHRLGLQHPLNVIRFYTRQTLEEAVVHDRKIALPDAAAIIVAEERKRTLIESDNEGDGDDDYISDAYEESLNLDEPSEGISEIEGE